MFALRFKLPFLQDIPAAAERVLKRPLLKQRTKRIKIKKETEPSSFIKIQDYPQDARIVDIRGHVYYRFQVKDEATTRKHDFSFAYVGRADGIRASIDKQINDYIGKFPPDYIEGLTEVNVELRDKRKVEYDYATNRMRVPEPYTLDNVFSNVFNVKMTEYNCVKSYLHKMLPKLSKLKKNPINALGNEDGVTTYEVKSLCEQYDIRMIAYNIHGDVISKHHPRKPNKSHASLYFLSYNNHIYALENKLLKRKPKTDLNQRNLTFECLQDAFTALLKAHILPADIMMRGKYVTSFLHNKTLYFSNDDYDTCYDILSAYGIEDLMTPKLSLSTIYTLLEQAYTSNENYNSFFPIPHNKQAFLFSREQDPKRKTITIDKNKAYSSVLKNLPNLLTTDYRTNPIQTAPFVFERNALYIAEPETPNFLMPGKDIYCGDYIEFCRGKIVFNLLEKISCEAKDNFYQYFVPDLYRRLPEYQAKTIVNRMIGMFQQDPIVKERTTALPVSAESLNRNYDHIPFGDQYLELTHTKVPPNIYNRKPIAIQIKDNMNRLLYEKMLELNLTDEDIVQISTDAITFYNSPKVKPPQTQTTLDGWKFVDYKPIKANIFESHNGLHTMKLSADNDNTLILGNAGNGKSYHIQNNIPKDDYIILTAKHSALTSHRNAGLHCNVIQSYEYRHTLPTEHHIIGEELGIFSREHWDILYQCFLMGKKLTLLGDFNQLLPVGESAPFSSPDFLNYLFKHQQTKNDNYRNNFTPEYYHSLYTSTDPEYLRQELQKHSAKTPEEADIIIAYRRCIRDLYNKRMFAHHNKSLWDADIPMVCKDNALKDKDIYNQYAFLSQEIDPEDRKHFDVAYARTLYSVQGDAFKSIYIAPEDLHFFTKPREAYTLISRLSQSRV